MTPYLLSLAVGVLVGAIYALFGVRSPAPPIIALVGLLGILVGEQVPPLVRGSPSAERTTWLEDQVELQFLPTPFKREQPEFLTTTFASRNKTVEANNV